MDTLKKQNWSAIAAALAALGIVSSADPLLAAISVVAMVIVFGVSYGVRLSGRKMPAGWLSILLYCVSTVLAVIFGGAVLPLSLPSWGGDVAMYVTDWAAFIEITAPYAATFTASATVIYNALKPLVFDRLKPEIAAETEVVG